MRCGKRVASAIGILWVMLLTVPLVAQEESPLGELVFQSDMTGDYEIYRVNADGSDLRNLTNHPGRDLDPSWSPDGQYLAFVSDRDGVSNGIYVMDADGNNVRRLTDDDGNERYPSWSPDGCMLAFLSSGDGYTAEDGWVVKGMYVMDSDGGNIRRVADVHYGYSSPPAWSPDNQQLLFFSERYGLGNVTTSAWEMILVDVGQEEVMVSDWYFRNYFWSPDGREIIFGDCYIVITDPKLVERQYPPLEDEFTVSWDNFMCISPGGWSPDSQYISLDVSFRGYNEHNQAGLYIMDVASGDLRQLTFDEVDYQMAWSPDSRHIAYVSDWKIYVVNIETGEIVALTENMAGKHDSPVWRPQAVDTKE